MQLVDRKTGALVEVPDAQAQAAFRSGQFGIPAGARLPVVTAGGQVGSVDAKEASLAMRDFERVATPEEVKAAQMEARYGGARGAAIAAAGGLARGAGEVFGVPTDELAGTVGDLASGDIIHGGDTIREALRESGARHGVVSGAGELVGMGAGLALGGEGALGGIGRLGEGAGTALAGRAGGVLARGAAEGAYLGGLGAVNEEALGDRDLTAEKLLAGMGHGAVIGGLASGALGAVAGVSSAARDEAGRYLSRLRPRDVDALAEKTFGHAAEGLGDTFHDYYAKASAALSGKDAETIKAFTALTPEGAEARRIGVFDAPVIQEAAERSIREAGDTMLRSGDLVSAEAKGELKAGYVDKAVKRGNEAEVLHAAEGHIRDLIEGAEALVTHEEGTGFAKSVESVSKSAYRAQAELGRIAAEGGNNGEVFTILDSVKRDVQRLTKGAYNGLRAVADPIDQRLGRRTAEWLDLSAQRLRNGLEDEALWGKAAADQREINAAWTKQIDASERFHRALTTEVGRDPNNPYQNVRGIDPGKAATYVRGLTNPHNDLTHKAVRDFVSSTKDLAGAIRRAYDLPADKVAEVERVHASAASLEHAVGRAEKSLVLANQFRALREGSQDSATGLLGTLGFAAGGLPGGLIGSAVGAVANPGRTVAQLAAVERIASKVDGRIGEGVRGFFSGKAAPRGKSPSALILEGSGGKPSRAVFEKSAAEVQRLASNPGELSERVARSSGDLGEHAPKLAAALSLLAVRATQLLAAKLPPGMGPSPTAVNPHLRPPEYSDAEMWEWARYAAAVNNPASVLESLRAGHVTEEEVRALRDVYPRIYERIRAEIVQRYAVQKKELPYQKRIDLAILFDVPLDATLEPDTLAAIQASFGPAPQGEPGTQQAGNARPMNVQGLASLTGTVGQNLEAGRSDKK